MLCNNAECNEVFEMVWKDAKNPRLYRGFFASDFFEVMKLADYGGFLRPACKWATFIYNVATHSKFFTYDAGRQAYTEIQERSPFS